KGQESILPKHCIRCFTRVLKISPCSQTGPERWRTGFLRIFKRSSAPKQMGSRTRSGQQATGCRPVPYTTYWHSKLSPSSAVEDSWSTTSAGVVSSVVTITSLVVWLVGGNASVVVAFVCMDSVSRAVPLKEYLVEPYLGCLLRSVELLLRRYSQQSTLLRFRLQLPFLL
ncbi:hypothetical protein Tcan_01741, partial [Toxocara canis]